MEIFADMFNYQFMVRAITVGLLVSLCASLLGVSMVLKRYSMIGDGLSHVGFAALAAAAAAGTAPLKVAIPVCIAAAFLMLRISENSKLKGDATVAIVCSGALAIGVMIISMSSGMNTDVNNYMFGSILSLSDEDALVSRILSIIVVLLFIVFYNRIFAVTFDENFAKASGIRVGFYQFLIALLTALTVVMGMRMMGSLLISSLIIFPAVIARKLVVSFKAVAVLSVFLSVICFLAGLILSFEMNLPTGASIVIINLIVLIAVTILNKLRGR